LAADEAEFTARPRAGDLALLLLLLGLLALGGSLLHAALDRTHAHQRSEPARQLAQELGLTGLALFTEARYTRHPELSDRHAAFQNHPMALEHFPSGTLVPPPRHLRD
jgi:hypothetical protein